MPFVGSTLYEDTYKPFRIGDKGRGEPTLQKVRQPHQVDAPHMPYAGEYDTEYRKLDGKQNHPDQDHRKCCHVKPQEKASMLLESSVRLAQRDPQLASQVLDPELLKSLSAVN